MLRINNIMRQLLNKIYSNRLVISKDSNFRQDAESEDEITESKIKNNIYIFIT